MHIKAQRNKYRLTSNTYFSWTVKFDELVWYRPLERSKQTFELRCVTALTLLQSLYRIVLRGKGSTCGEYQEDR